MTGRSSRKSAGKPVSAGAVLSSSMAHLGIGRRIKEFKVMKAWPETVGESISRRTRPVRLMGKTLYIDVSSPAWMTELRFQQAAIIERLNEVLGERAITGIVFRAGEVKEPETSEAKAQDRAPEIGPEKRKFIERTVSGIKDETLRETIRRALEKAKEGS